MEAAAQETPHPARLGPPAWSNVEWLAGLQATDPSSAEASLRQLLVAGLRRALANRCGPATCEDYAQEALLRIRAKLQLFRGDSGFLTWAMALAVRLAFDDLRHQRWKEVSFEALTEGAQDGLQLPSAEEGTPERSSARAQVLSLLGEAIQGGLTALQRRVLLAELSGMPQREIALQLQTTPNALYKLSHDARRGLKRHLEAAGVTSADALWAFE